jgi:hypothetical protein
MNLCKVQCGVGNMQIRHANKLVFACSHQTSHNSKLFVKYPKLGLLGPNFFQTKDKMKNLDEHNTLEGGQGTKLIFLPKLVLTRISSLALDLP